MSSTLLKQADKLTLGLVGAACIAALGDAYVKRVKTVDDGQKIVDALYTDKQRLEKENPRSSSVHDDQVDSVLQRAQKIVQEAGDGKLSTLVYYPKHSQHTEQLEELKREVQQIKKEARKDVIASITGYAPKN